MRAKPSSNSRSNKPNRSGRPKPHLGNPKNVTKNKSTEKKVVPDLSVLRQPVDTSIHGLKQAVKVFETGTPEVLHLLTYDCDVVYECKICRNLFRSIANFISHKRVYCTERYSRSQDLQRNNKEADELKIIYNEKAPERLPTRVTARKDLTSIVDTLNAHKLAQNSSNVPSPPTAEQLQQQLTTVLLEPMENTTHGVFQTVLKTHAQEPMKNQVAELHNLLAQNEVVLGPDGKVLQNGFSNSCQEDENVRNENESELRCSICNVKFANRKTFAKHKKTIHESVKSAYPCPVCRNDFSNPWSVYRHLYKVHRKTNEQVRRLRAQIHKKEVKIDKSPNNNTNKKTSPSNKKKSENEQHQKIIQDNKEWMDHLEDDGDFQRCGGCAKKFERKAALTAHSQICQKRIAACHRVEQSHHPVPGNKELTLAVVPVVSLSPLSCSKKPIPKPSPEKKIGIQVRMNYCKNSVGSPAQMSDRQRSSSRSIVGDESDLEAVSVDGRDSIFNHQNLHQMDLKESSVLQKYFSNANKCHNSDRVEKVNSYLNNTANRIDNVHTYEISTCRRTVLRSSSGKSKNLEEKCTQLRSALENGFTTTSKSQKKIKEGENHSFFDGNADTTSESNTSGVSSLSSQLTPLVDNGFVCEVEQSIEIKNINISRSVKKSPNKETDPPSNGDLHLTVNRRTYKENIKFSPPRNRNYEELSQSVMSTEVPIFESNLHVDSNFTNDDEISVDLKPLGLLHEDNKGFLHDNELENTAYLTRNQLKAICKDDMIPSGKGLKPSTTDQEKIDQNAIKVKTQEIFKKRFKKYVDETDRSCKICKKKIKTVYNIYYHLQAHTLWKRYKCLVNGCTYQSFMKASVFQHLRKNHTKSIKTESIFSLIGLIDPSKWNLKFSINVKNIPQKKVTSKLTANKSNKKTVTKKKTETIVKKALKLKNLPKSKIIQRKVVSNNKKRSLSKLVSKNATKQRLLTDFKHFKHIPNTKKESPPPKKKLVLLKHIKEDSAKVKESRAIHVKSPSPKSQNLDLLENVRGGKTSLIPVKPQAAKKLKKITDSQDDIQVKQNLLKTETKRDESIANHDTLDHLEHQIGRGRSSRSSSRKSSINSVDHHKPKNGNLVVKLEEVNNYHNSNEPPSLPDVEAPVIVDESSSLEEEESQESDRQVDDSHLKKIVMEVIFGASEGQLNQLPGRPVRNKTRPKRDSDFILGNQQKDSDKESGEAKSLKNRKSMRLSFDSEPLLDFPRKPK